MALTLTTEGMTAPDIAPQAPPELAIDPNDVFGMEPPDFRDDHEKAMDTWRQESAVALDAAVLDPKSYGDERIPHGYTPDEWRKTRVVDDWMRLHTDGQEPPMGPLREFERGRLAQQAFGGAGADSDESLFAEITGKAQGRKDARDRMTEVRQRAIVDVFTSETKMTDGKLTRGELDWPQLKAELASKPGYDPDREPEMMAAFYDTRAEAKEKLNAYKAPLDMLWGAMKAGKSPDEFGRVAYDTASSIPKDKQSEFLEAVAMRAQTLPKEQQATFWSNFSKAASRGISSFRQGAGEEITMAGLIQPTDPLLGIADAVYGTDNYQESETSRKQGLQDFRLDREFVRKVQDINNGVYDPIQYLSEKDSGKRIMEEIAYQVVPVTVNSLTMAMPFVGMPAMFAGIKGGSHNMLMNRFTAAGMEKDAALDAAETWSLPMAMVETALEKVGFGIWSRKLPGLSKAIDSMGDKIANRALRMGAKTLAIGAAETAVEVAQDTSSWMIQDLAAGLDEDLPDVQWTGEGGAFDGFWANSAVIFGTMLPMSILGAAGGLSQESRNAAFRRADPLERLALGMTPEASAAIDNAAGPSSLSRAIDNAWEGRDPNSPEALAAVEQLKLRVDQTRRASTLLEEIGYSMPAITAMPDGSFIVRDNLTGEEVGRATTTAELDTVVRGHTVAMESMQEDEMRQLATWLGAAKIAAKDSGIAQELNLSRRFGMQDVEEMGPAAVERFMAEVALQEQAEGGDGSATRAVFGYNLTETRDGVKQMTNRIFQGANIGTLFHENWHGARKQAKAAGNLTREDDIRFLRAFDAVLKGRQTREVKAEDGSTLAPATRESFLPDGMADADISETHLDEAIAEVAEVLTFLFPRNHTTNKHGLTRKLVSTYLGTVGRLAPEATRKFSGFIRAIRAKMGLAMSRAYHVKKAIAKGELDPAEIDTYMGKLFGTDEQAEHDTGVQAELGRIFNQEEDVEDDNIPFAIGRVNDEAAKNQNSKITEIPESVPSLRKSEVRRMLSDGPHKIIGLHLNEGSGIMFEVDAHTLDKVVMQPEKDGEPGGSHRVRIAASFHLPEIIRTAAALTVEDKMPERGAAKIHDLINSIKWQGMTYRVRVKGITSAHGSSHARSMKIESILIENAPASVTEAGAGHRTITDSSMTPEGSNVDSSAADVNLGDQGNAVFAIGRAEVADRMQGGALSLVRDPIRRVQAMSRVARDFGDLSLSFQRIEALAGRRMSKGQLRQEANAREDLAADEKTGAVWAKYGSLLADDDLTRIKSQPVHAYLAVKRADGSPDPLHGRIMSKAQAMKRYPERYALHRGGEYDGADNVSRSIYGGQLMPDQAAQELFDAGLISEPYTDAMWEALEREQNSVVKNKEALAKALEEIREAKREAKREASEWLATQGKEQETAYNPKQEILASLRMLDAIVLALPPEVRGQVGGYTQMAQIATDEARLAFLKDKLKKADKALESFLRVQFNTEWLDLLKRAKPDKDNPGQRPIGQIDADALDIMRAAEAAMWLDFSQGEAEADRLDALADHEDTKPHDADKLRATAQMVRLTNNWSAADAARREQAVIEGTRIYYGGLAALRIKNSARAERLRGLQTSAKQGTGKAGDRMERKKISRAEKGSRAGQAGSIVWELLSFGQLTNVLFGEKSNAAKWFNAKEIAASNALEDGVQAKMEAIESMFESLSGSRFGGEKLRHRMQTAEAVNVVDSLGKDHTFTESEAISFLLMWRQEDGKRHMLGQFDDEGNLTSEWGWTEENATVIESQLSPEASAMMAFLGTSYGEEYGRINDVFRRIWNVSMPRHKFYAPLTVKPSMGKQDAITDPISGDSMGVGMTPGSLKNRSQTAVTEPEFKDAFQVFLTHARQMEHFISYAEFARDAMAIVNRREIRNTIEAVSPTAAETLSKWVDYFAQGGLKNAATTGPLNRFFSGILTRFSGVALIGRVSVLAMQSLQMAASLYKMPTGAFLSRFARLQMGQLGWGDAIKSEYIQRRLKETPPVVRDVIMGLAAGTPLRAKYYATKAARGIAGADALFTAGTYAIFYDYHLTQARKAGIPDPEKHAHAEAERLTDQVAQPMRTGARSWYEISIQSNPSARALWNFASDPRQKFSLIAYEALRHDVSGKDKAAAVAKAAAVTWMVSGILQAVVRSVFRDLRNDDDDELFDERHWDLKRLGLMALTGPFGGMPVFGDMIEGSIYKAAGEWMPSSTLLDGLANAFPAAWNLIKLDSDDVLKDIEAVLTGGATFSGTSAAGASAMHAVRDAVNIYENFDEED